MWKLMENIIDNDDINALVNFLQTTERFTNGPKVEEFEEAWSKWLNINFSVMLNSGASGNFLAIALVKELFGIGEVIVPSLGWSSDVSSIIQLGMTPVFVDVDPITLGVNASSLKMALNDNTKAVVIVHALGFNAINEDVKSVIDQSGVFVIEDCCEAHGALLELDKQKKIGTYGHVSIFSFYFGHHITTVEGGMICMQEDYIYQLAIMFRSHGMTREASGEIYLKYQNDYPDLNPLFTFAVPGFNFRSTELNAVLGLSQIKKLDHNIKIRSQNLEIWLESINPQQFKIDYFQTGNSCFALPLILKEKDKNLMRNVCKKLDDREIEYRLGTAGGGNLSRQPFIKNYQHRIVDDQAVVNHIHDFGLYVGNGTHVKKNDIEVVAQELNEIK